MNFITHYCLKIDSKFNFLVNPKLILTQMPLRTSIPGIRLSVNFIASQPFHISLTLSLSPSLFIFPSFSCFYTHHYNVSLTLSINFTINNSLKAYSHQLRLKFVAWLRQTVMFLRRDRTFSIFASTCSMQKTQTAASSQSE